MGTEELEAEVARCHAELEQLGYVVSHDLQEPLRVITSFTELLQRRHAAELSPSAREYLDYISDGSKRMQEMIRDLLEYSRVNSRGRPFEDVDLAAVLEEVRADLRFPIEDTGARVDGGPLPTVRADPAQMTRLMANLVGNALKFRAPGRPPEIRVAATREGDGWRVEVRDNGIGIASEQGDRIFKVFQRLHDRQDYPGTGIGLSIAERIVERHGGRIGYESTPGSGTTFWFTLPGTSPPPR